MRINGVIDGAIGLLQVWGLVFGVVLLQPHSYRGKFLPVTIIALAIYMFLHTNVNQAAVMHGVFVALATMIGAILFREWPRMETAVLLVIASAISIAITKYQVGFAIFLAIAGACTLRVILIGSRPPPGA